MPTTHPHELIETAAMGRRDQGIGPACPWWSDTAIAPLRVVKAREHLFFEGDPRHCVFEVRQGALALSSVSADGRRQISRFVFPGDFIGMGWERVEPYGAEATVDSIVACWPSLMARRVAKEAPDQLDWIGAQLADEAHALQDLARLVSIGGALERVAGFLYQLCERIGARRTQVTLRLPMTRADIGDHLGLTLETVSRELSRLRRMRVLGMAQATQVTILDPLRLRQLCGNVFA